MKIILSIGLLLVGTTLWAQKVHSYVLTVNEQGVSKVIDSCEVMTAPKIRDKRFVIEYRGAYYPFEIWDFTESENKGHYYGSHEWVTHIYGTATCWGKPYGVKCNFYGSTYVIWLIPLRFHGNHDIDGLRAFIFTNDPKTIKRMCE